jgi:hypothetical protein
VKIANCKVQILGHFRFLKSRQIPLHPPFPKGEKPESFNEGVQKKLSSLCKREAGRDFREGLFKKLN